jgi:hypothetical protein
MKGRSATTGVMAIRIRVTMLGRFHISGQA